MRIAGAILAIFPISIIILVQSLAAGTADALTKNGQSGGTYGFVVAIAFIVGAALMFGRVMRGALGVFVVAGLVAWLGAANSIFGDLWVWGAVALIYAGCIFWGMRRTRTPEPTPAGFAVPDGARFDPRIGASSQPNTRPGFDPQTGQPIGRRRRFDPYTGKPLEPK